MNFISFDVGTRNLGIAAATVESDGTAMLQWLDTADISASCSDRCLSKLWTYLDGLMELLSWQKYIIYCEKQPAKACSLMRTVELGIRNYFLMQAHRKLASVTVKSVSPRRKLDGPLTYVSGATQAQKYRARKKAGLEQAISAFGELPDVVRFLKTGKGDDAADASLYIVQFGGAKRFIGASEFALQNGRARELAKETVAAEKAAAKEAVRQERQAVKDVEKAARAAEREAKRAAKAAAKRGTKPDAPEPADEPAENATVPCREDP